MDLGSGLVQCAMGRCVERARVKPRGLTCALGWCGRSKVGPATALSMRLLLPTAWWLVALSWNLGQSHATSPILCPCAAHPSLPRFPHPAPMQIAIVGKGLTFDSGGYNLKAGGGSSRAVVVACLRVAWALVLGTRTPTHTPHSHAYTHTLKRIVVWVLCYTPSHPLTYILTLPNTHTHAPRHRRALAP